jgi:hypothetical protein
MGMLYIYKTGLPGSSDHSGDPVETPRRKARRGRKTGQRAYHVTVTDCRNISTLLRNATKSLFCDPPVDAILVVSRDRQSRC